MACLWRSSCSQWLSLLVHSGRGMSQSIPLTRLGPMPLCRRILVARYSSASSSSYGSVDEGVIPTVPYSTEKVNSVTLIGNLGSDVRITFTPTDKAVGTARLAMGQRKENAMWIDLEMWEDLAQMASRQLSKGSRVQVQGRLRVEEYTDRQGVPKSKIKVVARELFLVSKYSEEESNPQRGEWPGREQTGVPKYSEEGYNPRREEWPGSEQPAQRTESRVANAPSSGGSRSAGGASGGGGVPGEGNGAALSPSEVTNALWSDLFTDPNSWNDNRQEKAIGDKKDRYPDFKRKQPLPGLPRDALWVDGKANPMWALQKLQELDEQSGVTFNR
eukprot:TRINITY_DN39781_c0_g1_i1.p1 TRINITY_DN39781_c0_g1~~TRINITY_DN39781_c0_g1_i1.p1  ORF type:complete len:331 (+),score=38.36 TRINITY_DN39781_c0_g1_i1:352-1344(+)